MRNERQLASEVAQAEVRDPRGGCGVVNTHQETPSKLEKRTGGPRNRMGMVNEKLSSH